MMRVLCFLLAGVLASAQSATTTTTTDLNGRPVAMGERDKSAQGDVTERRKSVNGRLVPIEQTSERVIREDANGRVVERITKRYDDNGKLNQTERVTAEESALRGGVKTVKESVAVSDISGRFVETERRTTETRIAGTTTTVNVAVDRSNPNGSFLPAERRSTVTTGNSTNQQSHEVVQLPDLNGRLREASRTDKTLQINGDKRVENSSRYEPDATGKMALQEQRVETTTKRPGGEVVETNIYVNIVAAQIRGGSNAPRIREQRVVDRQIAADGTVKEALTVRRPGSDPDRLGEAKKISETVCTGKCLPDAPKPAEAPKPAAPKPAATVATTKGK